MKGGSIWCLAMILVVANTRVVRVVEGQQAILPCALINIRMLSCYIHVMTCHPNCKEAPCNEQCTPPPISCCVQLGRLAKGIDSDADAKNICDCIQETVIDRQGTPFTGHGLSALPKECMLAMKLPPISPDTKCRKWKKKTILGRGRS